MYCHSESEIHDYKRKGYDGFGIMIDQRFQYTTGGEICYVGNKNSS